MLIFVFHVSVFHLCVLFGKISIHILAYFCFLGFVFSLMHCYNFLGSASVLFIF